MAGSLLPLFPLQVVLFPRADLALHIFEERYKLMIRECLEHGWEFGIVLVQETSIAGVGCTASVENVVRKYEDGRMDIVVRGQRRFEVVRLDQQMPYARCESRFFDDEDESRDAAEAGREAALALYEELKRKLPGGGRGEDAPEPDRQLDPQLDPAQLDPNDPQLSFQIAARLPVDLSFRQSLLPLRSETERLGRVVAYLQKLEAFLARAVQVRAKVSGNGRAH